MKHKKQHMAISKKRRIKSILKRELSRRGEVIFGYIHGSFLLPIPCGDVDVALYIEETALLENYWEYEADLAAALDPLVGIPVDILVLNQAPLALRYHATRGKVLMSRDEPVRFTFLEETWREYFDCQPLFKAFLNDLLSIP